MLFIFLELRRLNCLCSGLIRFRLICMFHVENAYYCAQVGAMKLNS